MHLHFERNVNSKCDCTILSLSWMGKVPDELPEEEGWKLNRNNYYQEGWLATGNIRGVVGVTFTTSHARRAHELPLRTNYNLRGHRSDVILVKWNEPYQKLASCDSSGVIFVWIKYEGRWSIELINDRSTPVTHFSWSHDGRMALICYQDGFVLVGSVAGQRYWSSMLSLDARITCGCWTPDDNQVYLGTASAQLVVMDVHGAMVSQVQLVDEGSITSMAWSCEKFKMEEGEDVESTANHVLAVALGKGEIVFLRGHDDVSPVRVNTGMRGETLAMEWANSRELLAVAGTLIAEAGEPEDAPPYKNVVKFYTDTGILIYTVPIPCNQAPVTALTWGHAARRVFVGVGGAICTARVWRAVAPLQLLARVRAAQALRHPRLAPRLPLPPRLQPALANLFAHTIRCNVPETSELRRFVSRPPPTGGRLHCTMIRHGDDEQGCYTLYLEHLGGLVPLLKGRRTSKIRPEFVIFDPQAEEKSTIMNNGNSSSSTNGKDSSSGAASSSSAGSSKGSMKGFNSPKGSPRTSRHARRFPTPQMHIDTSSSDTEREEGCAASPKMQRRRKARERRKARQAEREDTLEGLPIDCLPEDVRLVEVTSNIWGTKFKMHGLAKNVPANLGQVTYKTSLLHLQPRQMTLMITELRDDFPIGPDPTFNPNIFSEDEEDVFHSGESATESPSHVPVDRMKRKLTLVDRPTPLPAAQQSETHTASCMAASLARAESYDEFPYIDNGENSNDGFTPRAAPASVPGRHAISPLRCEASVPTLQSPKNAVAPTDIIFERPSPQTVACGGRGDFYGRADYTVRSDSLALKNLVEQPYVKKVDASTPDASCLSKLRKNICGRDSYDVNARILKSLCARTEGGKDELRYIDEEGSPPARVQRTTTVVPISPVCAAPTVDTMTRSCSVGYLDLVDPRHAQVTVAALRGEPPRRLVLVNPRRQRRRRNPPTPPSPPAKSERAPSLRRCGKSRSLDSSDMPLAASAVESAKLKKLKVKGKVTETEEIQRVLCSSCRLSAPIGVSCVGGVYVCTTCATRAPPPLPPPAPSPRLATDSDSDYSKYYSSLEQLALRLLASRATRRGRADRETSSAPASPRAARSRPESPAPIPPRTPKPQRTRHSSASPIRQLLNSPLLNRRRNKKPSESSDDEYSTGGYSEVNGKNFRDLESFQKAQLRNKLIRAGGVPNTAVAPAATGECRARRQLVMHNKAPMWNENSQVYQLDFGGRVTQESAKNFQIEYHGKQVMQFGRIDGNAYTLDFQYPFSALQAFAVALANVTQRLK